MIDKRRILRHLEDSVAKKSVKAGYFDSHPYRSEPNCAVTQAEPTDTASQQYTKEIELSECKHNLTTVSAKYYNKTIMYKYSVKKHSCCNTYLFILHHVTT